MDLLSIQGSSYKETQNLLYSKRPTSDSIPEICCSSQAFTGKLVEKSHMVEQNWHTSYHEIVEALKINYHMPVWHHLKEQATQKSSRFGCYMY